MSIKGLVVPAVVFGTIGAVYGLSAIYESDNEKAAEASQFKDSLFKAVDRFGRLDSKLGPGQMVKGNEYLVLEGMRVDQGVKALLKRYDVNTDGVINLRTMEHYGVGKDGMLHTPMVNPWGNYKEEYVLFETADNDHDGIVRPGEIRDILNTRNWGGEDEPIKDRMVWETDYSISQEDRAAVDKLQPYQRTELIDQAVDNGRLTDPLVGTSKQTDRQGADLTLGGTRSAEETATYVFDRYDRDSDGKINLRKAEHLGVDSSGKLRTLVDPGYGPAFERFDGDRDGVITRAEMLKRAEYSWGPRSNQFEVAYEMAITLTDADLRKQALYGPAAHSGS